MHGGIPPLPPSHVWVMCVFCVIPEPVFLLKDIYFSNDNLNDFCFLVQYLLSSRTFPVA